MAAILPVSRLIPANLAAECIAPREYSSVCSPTFAHISPGVLRGHEFTLKNRRIESGLAPLDHIIGGGVVRGRISEIIGPTGAGKTSLATALAATVTRVEAAAWIETRDSLDPTSIIAAGIEPARLLWVSCAHPHLSRRHSRFSAFGDGPTADPTIIERSHIHDTALASLKTAEWILAAGGFGLLVIDCGPAIRFIPQSAALRLARAAERSGAAIVVLAQQRLCGTFAVLSLELSRRHACFNLTARGSCTTFDGQTVAARVLRNKLGGAGATAVWRTSVDPQGDLAIPPSSDDHLGHASLQNEPPAKLVARTSV